MEIGNITIVTPMDNPCQYDPSWRNDIAMALVDFPNEKLDPEYVIYKNDPWIKRQVTYLKAVKSGKALTKDQHNLRLANIWYQGSRLSDTRYRLEPLLLTATNFNVISLDIGGGNIPVDAFKAYERLYFNIRLDDGSLNKSCQLRQYFALPTGELDKDTPPEQLWKMVGALMGYDTLVNIWLWTDAHGKVKDSQDFMLDEMWRVAQSSLFMNIFANKVGNESMAKLLASFTAQTKMLRDEKESGQSGLDTTRTLMAILYKSSPEIISAAKDVDALPTMTEAIRARIAAQRAIGSQQIEDAGKEVGEDALNAKLAEHFKSK